MGISFAAIFVRLALPAPPVITGFYRMLFASVLVGGFLLVAPRPGALPRRSALLALVGGACFGTDLALWNTAIVQTSVATATLLVNTTPVYVGLYTVLVLGQALHARFVGGAALALLGCATLLGVSWDDVDHAQGGLLALCAALFYAGYLLLMTAARREGSVVPALFASSLGATAVLGLYGWLGGDSFSGFPSSSWAAMAAATVVSQIGGVMSILWALRYLPATMTSVMLLAQPVGTALLGWLLLGEALGPLQALGGAAVLAGIVLAFRATTQPGSPGSAPQRIVEG